MQTCSNCGSVSRDGAKFCTTCGSRLNQIVDNTQSTGWVAYEPSEPETADAPDAAVAQNAPDETMASSVVPEKSVNVLSDTSSAPTPPPSWAWGQSTTTANEEPAPAISEPVVETAPDTSSDDSTVEEAAPDDT
ncbi:MAG: zinc-ribbon domain-containing protein, partial [Thermomicrobiales bacterium]